MAKTYLAQDILDFINNGWLGDSWYMDGVSFTDREDIFDWNKEKTEFVKGFDPSTPVSVEDIDGAILWQGSDRDADPTGGDGYSFKRELDKFLKKRSFTRFSVDVPNDKLEEFKALLKQLKVTISK